MNGDAALAAPGQTGARALGVYRRALVLEMIPLQGIQDRLITATLPPFRSGAHGLPAIPHGLVETLALRRRTRGCQRLWDRLHPRQGMRY